MDGRDPKIVEEHQKKLREVRESPTSYPAGRFSGRGIVICGGGRRYFTCAWVCIKMLRRLGCILPIELWHLGSREMTSAMSRLMEPLNVRTVDAYKARETFPARILNGWELKPYALINSSFKEVLMLDADNVPVVDPTYLFESSEYKEHGSIFWPDYGRLNPTRMIWSICGVEYQDEPEFESGQLIINKKYCWASLLITMHLNEYSDFYYQHIHGDKDTFHMGWRISGQGYSMPSTGIHSLAGTMCQHDFGGRRIFQHRNLRKWTLDEINPVTEDFIHERICIQFLKDLKAEWCRMQISMYTIDEFAVYRDVCERKRFQYTREGYDSRTLEFRADLYIGVGRARMEQFWNVQTVGKKVVLQIYGDEQLTSEAIRQTDGMYRGKWVVHEQMGITLHHLAK